jgi:hypothetical protein
VGGRRWLRYGLLLALGVGWAADVLHRQGIAWTDWLNFEIAARTFIHFQHKAVYAGNPFGLYARDPILQIGPPAWLPVAAFQWLNPWHVNIGFVMAMVGLGVIAVASVETVSGGAGADMSRRRHGLMLLVAAAVTVDWSYNVARWHHLDDALALSLTALACPLIQRRRSWWLLGLLLGTAVAAKPWAIILTPVLMGLPRELRSKTVLATIAVAGAWWAPFVVGATGTLHALGTYPIPVRPGSVWWLLGVHGEVQRWLRPLQFAGGIAIGVYVARRSPRGWLAAPLAALAFRVLTDPFMWSYYGMGPVLFAFMWDMTRPGRWTRFPVYSFSTLVVDGLLPWLPLAVAPGAVSAWLLTVEWSKLAWGLGVLAAVAAEVRWSQRTREPTRSVPLPLPAQA